MIKDFERIAKTAARRDALLIMEAGLQAIQPQTVLGKTLSLKGEILLAGGKKFDLRAYESIYVVGIGKASLAAGKFLESLLGDRITDGVIIDVVSAKLRRIRTFKGTHPFPTDINIAATDEAIALLKRAKKRDLVIAVISGGGSSLLCSPNRMTCVSLRMMTERLFAQGADIKDMNALRKHTSLVHGGNVARLAYPAEMLGLILSDVPFNDLSVVASGPTFFDETTKADAERVVKKYGIKGIKLCETPKDKKYFERVTNVCVLDNRTALSAMRKAAEGLGYTAKVQPHYLKGEARKAGEKIAEEIGKANPKTVLISGGETTVIVKKKGKGGRNLELALAGLKAMPDNGVILAVSSDGKDHIKEAAGAIADHLIAEKVREKGYSPDNFLDNNRSYAFFVEMEGVIRTERTGSNVSDLVVALKG